MSPEFLGRATKRLVLPPDPRLVVGIEWADDAGVVALDRERALVQTVDFMTPIVDDPFTYGAIAATNALSDVYAMNGEPLSALNILAFPEGDLPEDVLERILQGGLAKILEAGAVLAGGHSVRDAELKYGLSVTGVVHPLRIWRNGGARPGDALVLTKPLGTGILTTARKRGAIEDQALDACVESMLRLNRGAMLLARDADVHACTDVTGNGLAGHAWEMARASGVELQFWFEAIPTFPGAVEQAAAGHCTGGAKANRAYVGSALRFEGLSGAEEALVLDPQTSGGLLFAIPAAQADALVSRLRADHLDAARVGEAVAGAPGVRVTRVGARS